MNTIPYFTVEGAARYCKVTGPAIREAIKRKELKPLKLLESDQKVLKRADVIRWKNTERKRGPKPK